jgi:hypothetical protein
MTLLEASSSRMIATLGGLAILMLYMGFGIFALYSFGLTCQLPPSMSAVSTFLSYANWVPRWRVEGTGGWMLTCTT